MENNKEEKQQYTSQNIFFTEEQSSIQELPIINDQQFENNERSENVLNEDIIFSKETDYKEEQQLAIIPYKNIL